ncbi:hypothetical protein GPECTOR_258g654 [Gonium pectorale]|uniref:PHD-type domain-containing protein n=1 Tax=Gonium pectorale TaxID=33097 RepID=A0A150FW69_GONPE|nr:hypothetical protein GPECTOR_258g654 [Gonium pectorale]|eukprot:KXZ41863.1 hypothetical protein GPECTOR_258g654 [Gonium pectorale]
MSLRAALSDFQSQQERAAAAAQQACGSEASNALEATERARQLEQQLQDAEKQLLDLRMANSSLEAALKASEEKLQQAQAAVEASRANMTQLPEGQCAVLDKLLHSPVAQECLSRDPGLALMWLDQLQYLERARAGGKALNGMRWHASTLRFGLTLFNKGGAKLYEELAHQVPLPSVSQLRNYKRFTADGPGWNAAAAATCAEVVKAAGADTRGGLAFNEMKLNSGLVFNVATDALVGWADLDAGNEVDHLKGLLNPDTGAAVSSIDRSVATHVLHFTFTSLGPKPTRYSVAYFFTNGIKALDLASTVSDGVRLLSAAGLNVTYTVCDGASENRAWMEKAADRELARSIAKETGIELPSSNVTSHLGCFRHPANPTQPVIMLTDGPHLAKKGRNNLEKSYGGTGVKGRNTAEMRWPDGRGGWVRLSWLDVCTLVKWDMHNSPQLMRNVTCFGAVALARFYLQTGGTSVIVASLNQNCVENAFSQLRGHGQNRMPDAQRVINGEQSLRLDEILRVVNKSRAAGKRTASYAQAYDDEGALMDALPIGQITEPCSALVSVFEDVQKRLIMHVQSAQSVLRSGPLAIRLWIHEVRYDSSAWQQFRTACEQMGLSELACKVPDVKRDQLDEQLRALMGRLVSKYVHANLVGLLRHTKVLAAKDRAEVQALRDERRADAARSAKGAAAVGKKALEAPPIAHAVREDVPPGGPSVEPDADGEELWDSVCCEECGCPHPEESMLLCDGCGGGWHTFCLSPPLPGVPDGDWYCPYCLAPRPGAKPAEAAQQAVEAHMATQAAGAAAAAQVAATTTTTAAQTAAAATGALAAAVVTITTEEAESAAEAISRGGQEDGAIVCTGAQRRSSPDKGRGKRQRKPTHKAREATDVEQPAAKKAAVRKAGNKAKLP